MTKLPRPQNLMRRKSNSKTPPNIYRPSNHPISFYGCAGWPSYFPSFLLGFLRTPVSPGITLLTCLPCCFFAHALCFHLFPFCSLRSVSDGLPRRKPQGSFCPKRSGGKKIASGNLTAWDSACPLRGGNRAKALFKKRIKHFCFILKTTIFV